MALLAATVERLCRWPQGPRALVATHFTEIFRLELIQEPKLVVSHFRVLQEKEATASKYNII